MARRVFVDTNCFLHLRDLKDLSWREIFAGEQAFEIFVAAIVVDELDRLKTEKTGRIRDRARAALRLIEQASDRTGMRIEIRAADPAVHLVVAQSPRIDWSSFPQLDPKRADDELVASALSEAGGEQVSLLSFDMGPLIRARRIGLHAVRAPENWTLPAQQDPLEKENANLRRELAAARATKPTLQARWKDQDETGLVRCVTPRLPPLSADVQERLLEALVARNPKAWVRSSSMTGFGYAGAFGGVSDYDVIRYGQEHAAFLSEGREQFARLHELVEHALRFGQVWLELENVGQVTAEGLRLELSAVPARLFGSKFDMKFNGGAIEAPEAPEPPTDLPTIPPHVLGMRRDDHDPTAFYWQERARGAARGVLTNDEFRPAQKWSSSFYLLTGGSEGALKVELHGRNLTAPVMLETRVVVEAGEAPWDHPAVLSRLPRWMADVIEECLGGGGASSPGKA